MRKFIFALLFAALPTLSFANEGPHLDKANIDLHDKASLQRGAKLFANYCLSCHSAQFMRFNRMAKDIGLTDAQVKENLMFVADKVGEPMKVTMAADDAKRWFGNPPPDLSVIARARGNDYIYTYLRSFYLDPSRPTGVNNTVFPLVAMPDVLWELEGLKKPIVEKHTNAEGEEHDVITGFEMVKEGSMSPAEFDQAARDLTNFLAYVAEPVKLERQRLGVWVLLFLGVFFVVAYLLKKEYWKDVH